MSKGSNVSGHTHSKEELEHYSNQHNSNSDAYKAEMDNHANQLNPNNDEYKGEDEKEEY